MSDPTQAPVGTWSHAGPIEAFFACAARLARDDIVVVPEAIPALGRARADAQAALMPLVASYEALCTDPVLTACAPLRTEIDARYDFALGAAKRIDAAYVAALDRVEADCQAMVEAVRKIRGAIQIAAHSVSSTRGAYTAVAEAYRDAVAKGTRVRSLLAEAQPGSEFGQLYFQVGLLLERASDGLWRFLQLHGQAGRFAP